uniref:Hematopoietic cell signal transducer n=1 Tax=Equus caballus TaxID=9796 RepID=A0A9L0SFV4_HORSE
SVSRGPWNSPSDSPGHHLSSHSKSELPEDLKPTLGPHLTALITKVKPQGLGHPPASLWQFLLCPKHSPRVLEPLSFSPFHPQVQPQGVCDTPSASSFAPYAQSTALRVWSPSAAFLSWPPPSGSCSGCGPLSLPLLAGLVAADAVVSLLIVAVVFVCMRPRSRPTQGEGRGRGRARTGVGCP